MERREQKAVLEAVLFAMGNTVEVEKLAELIEENKRTTKQILEEMKSEWEEAGRGISIVEYDGAYQLCTKAEMYDYLIKIAASPRKYNLTETILETLSIIAYKQPVTKAEIEKIRGVSCDHAVNRLMEYDLVTELGRLDAPGRPLLFGTTEQFLRCFGVKSLDELPLLNDMKAEEFREEAEEEAKIQLKI